MSNKLITYIKEEEFIKLLKAEKNKDFRLTYLFAFGSGLRISEIIGYRRKFRRRTDKVTKVVVISPDSSSIEPLSADRIDLQAKTIKVVGGKGMKDRIVPLFPGFKEEYLKLLPLNIKRSSLQAHFKSLCKRVLGRDCHFHELRHGFGVMSTVNGVPMPFIQQAMGHSRLDTTGIYTKASPEEMKKAYAKAWGLE